VPNHLFYYSNHEYIGIWSEKTTPITCNPHAKRVVTSSTKPQEVEERKEVIFTYDVDFQVRPLFCYLHEIWPHIEQCIFRITRPQFQSLCFLPYPFWKIYASRIVHLAGEWRQADSDSSMGAFPFDGRWPDTLVLYRHLQWFIQSVLPSSSAHQAAFSLDRMMSSAPLPSGCSTNEAPLSYFM